MNALYLHHRSYDLSESPAESRTPFFQRFACGLGHAINDITRQLLFSFRLVFFMNVLDLSATNSGWLILEKQLVHTVMSPVCAILLDRIRVPFLSRKLGKRKSWHLCATILEAVFVPLFFTPCYLFQRDNGQERLLIYFGILNVILGVAGSLLDISHLSLIPFIAKNQMEAVELSAWRTAFTYLSGISTCAVAWVIFGLDSKNQISENSSKDFMVMTVILVGLGLLLAMIFHVGTKEPLCTNANPDIPLRKLSTLQAANFASLTSFIPSDARGELMARLATELNTETTKERDCPSRKTSRVSFCDRIRCTPISDQKEESATTKKDDAPKENLSSISNNVNSTVVDNRGFSGSAMKLSSDADSNGKSDQNRDSSFPSRKTSRVSFSDGIRWTTMRDQREEEPALPKKDDVPEENLSPSNVYCDGVDNRGFSGSIMELNSSVVSNDKNVDKVPAPINLPAVSLETKGVSLSETKANSKPFIISRDSEAALPSRKHAKRTIRKWLIDPRLYMVAVVYSCTRALQNHAYSYLPLFLIYRLRLSKESIAYLPLIMFISATVSSILSRKFVGIIGNKRCFTFAALLVVCSGVMSYFITQSNTVMIYPSVVLLGFGFSSMLVCSLSFATELIGKNKKNSGFIFAFMSLVSYVISGPLILIVQKLFPERTPGKDCPDCGDYLRLVFPFVAIALSTASSLIVLLLHCIDMLREKSSSTSED
ncbi:major facilitator superfamily domain-containing protein 12-like [Montipora foliosa]|uniref:major facilitator superfamily domain-containing protein 12-like n=1 Tax=Montipora foliosa TaxID=591990 RepID=UPI0035F184A9